jgi:hypothetical protein
MHHPAVVAAHLAVVRRAAAVLAEHAVEVPAPVTEALALVERWCVAGGVEAAALTAAATAAWDAGTEGRMSDDRAERARMWLATAAGNLAFLARRERGWKDAPRTILDAAASAASSLRVPGVPDRAAFAALADEHLANPAPVPGRRKTAGPPRPKRLGDTSDLGPLVSAQLERWKARRDPRQTTDPSTLAALLGARGLPVSEAVLRFEERYGGTRFAESPASEGMDFVLGPYALCRDDPSTPGADRGLVPIGLAPSDVWYLLDVDGAAWAQDTIEDPEPVPYAVSAAVALARLVLYQRCFVDRPRLGGADLDGRQGAAVAAALGLPLLPEASD